MDHHGPKKRLPWKGCQITPFLGTVRFSRCIPVGHNFLGSCFRRKAHGESSKRENERQKSPLYSHRTRHGSSTSTFIPTHQGEPRESDLGGVHMALAPGEINPPVFEGVIPEVNAQLEQDQTMLTRAVRRRDWAGRALVISGHSRALINTGCFSNTHFPAQQPLSPSAFGQVD